MSASIIADEPLYEVVGGRRVELLPMGAYQTSLATNLVGFISIFLNSHRMGRVLMETLFELAPGTQRRPDVAFVSHHRWPRTKRIPSTAAWDVVPELAVEVISPANLMDEIVEKVAEYFAAGVMLVWVVLTAERQIYVYQSPTRITVLEEKDTLDGGELLPGFTLPLKELFGEEQD